MREHLAQQARGGTFLLAVLAQVACRQMIRQLAVLHPVQLAVRAIAVLSPDHTFDTVPKLLIRTIPARPAIRHKDIGLADLDMAADARAGSRILSWA